MNPKLRINQKDFRVYEPETVTNAQGKKIQMTLCEELVNGRWEPFYSCRP
jgi:hypothetical protein